ncbi:hypothetical protein [Bradyrhizobium sp. AZCC 2230]|uniref:hypothetical protein n=1 Tax=Bradyrhizobium sp. AZCC 2230 TaxID=3117021 RepID=UPI002FF08FC9
MTTAALLALLGNPAAMAQTIGGGTSSVEPASPAVSSSLTLDARLIGGTRAGQEVFIDRLATGWPLPLRPAEPPTAPLPVLKPSGQLKGSVINSDRSARWDISNRATASATSL